MADITTTDVADWLELGTLTGQKLALMQRVVDAVVVYVRKHYVDPVTLTPPASDADWKLAQTMIAARYWKRKASPEGVISFDELGPIRIGRVDADAAALLDRKWGFA
jgi:hypothetical protein